MKACSDCWHATEIGPAFRPTPACTRVISDPVAGLMVALKNDPLWRAAMQGDARAAGAPCGLDAALFEPVPMSRRVRRDAGLD